MAVSILLLLLSHIHYIHSQAVKCSTMADCSFNGICKNDICECFPQWIGGHCASLNIIAGSKDAGLHSVVNGTRQTTWGGGAIYDSTSKQWHMIAAEMIDSCGMGTWLSNSQIVHATSDSPDGSYTRQQAVENTGLFFSHEPNIVKALDTGEFAVYFTHIYPPATFKYPCTHCKNGMTENCPTTGNNDYGRNWNQPLPTKMIYTNNISDPNAWSDIIDLTDVTPDIYIDTNLATYIFPNGSLIGILRNDNANNAKTYNLITAMNWKKNTSYKTHPMKPYDNASGKEIAYYGEDPFVWYDTRYDVVHTIWHYTYNGDTTFGLHAYSTDGGNTFHAFLDFSVGDYPSEWAYNQTAFYTDGSSVDFDTCERPHLILKEDGYTPIALTNGARPPNNGDYSFTLLRPINQN
eukprot:393606_1